MLLDNQWVRGMRTRENTCCITTYSNLWDTTEKSTLVSQTLKLSLTMYHNHFITYDSKACQLNSFAHHSRHTWTIHEVFNWTIFNVTLFSGITPQTVFILKMQLPRSPTFPASLSWAKGFITSIIIMIK